MSEQPWADYQKAHNRLMRAIYAFEYASRVYPNDTELADLGRTGVSLCERMKGRLKQVHQDRPDEVRFLRLYTFKDRRVRKEKA